MVRCKNPLGDQEHNLEATGLLWGKTHSTSESRPCGKKKSIHMILLIFKGNIDLNIQY